VVIYGNAGTHHEMPGDKPKAEYPQGESTEAYDGGGLPRSSEEVAVMAMERRGRLIRLYFVTNFNIQAINIHSLERSKRQPGQCRRRQSKYKRV
jgi:hypothetical protein